MYYDYVIMVFIHVVYIIIYLLYVKGVASRVKLLKIINVVQVEKRTCYFDMGLVMLEMRVGLHMKGLFMMI